jgi:hypothetical protein
MQPILTSPLNALAKPANPQAPSCWPIDPEIASLSIISPSFRKETGHNTSHNDMIG